MISGAWDDGAVVGDGGLGLWAALDEVFPRTEHQRCWNHRVFNVQDKLPKRLQAEARPQLHAMWTADTRAECERLPDGAASCALPYKKAPVSGTTTLNI